MSNKGHRRLANTSPFYVRTTTPLDSNIGVPPEDHCAKLKELNFPVDPAKYAVRLPGDKEGNARWTWHQPMYINTLSRYRAPMHRASRHWQELQDACKKEKRAAQNGENAVAENAEEVARVEGERKQAAERARRRAQRRQTALGQRGGGDFQVTLRQSRQSAAEMARDFLSESYEDGLTAAETDQNPQVPATAPLADAAMAGVDSVNEFLAANRTPHRNTGKPLTNEDGRDNQPQTPAPGPAVVPASASEDTALRCTNCVKSKKGCDKTRPVCGRCQAMGVGPEGCRTVDWKKQKRSNDQDSSTRPRKGSSAATQMPDPRAPEFEPPPSPTLDRMPNTTTMSPGELIVQAVRQSQAVNPSLPQPMLFGNNTAAAPPSWRGHDSGSAAESQTHFQTETTFASPHTETTATQMRPSPYRDERFRILTPAAFAGDNQTALAEPASALQPANDSAPRTEAMTGGLSGANTGNLEFIAETFGDFNTRPDRALAQNASEQQYRVEDTPWAPAVPQTSNLTTNQADSDPYGRQGAEQQPPDQPTDDLVAVLSRWSKNNARKNSTAQAEEASMAPPTGEPSASKDNRKQSMARPSSTGIAPPAAQTSKQTDTSPKLRGRRKNAATTESGVDSNNASNQQVRKQPIPQPSAVTKSGDITTFSLASSFSNGTGKFPNKEGYHRNDEWLNKSIAERWAKELGYPAKGHEYRLERLPAGFATYERKRPNTTGNHHDREIVGYPKSFARSLVKFWPHFVWMQNGGVGACECDLCPRVKGGRAKAGRGGQAINDSLGVADRGQVGPDDTGPSEKPKSKGKDKVAKDAGEVVQTPGPRRKKRKTAQAIEQDQEIGFATPTGHQSQYRYGPGTPQAEYAANLATDNTVYAPQTNLRDRFLQAHSGPAPPTRDRMAEFLAAHSNAPAPTQYSTPTRDRRAEFLAAHGSAAAPMGSGTATRDRRAEFLAAHSNTAAPMQYGTPTRDRRAEFLAAHGGTASPMASGKPSQSAQDMRRDSHMSSQYGQDQVFFDSYGYDMPQ